jgi:hypothetical protein
VKCTNAACTFAHPNGKAQAASTAEITRTIPTTNPSAINDAKDGDDQANDADGGNTTLTGRSTLVNSKDALFDPSAGTRTPPTGDRVTHSTSPSSGKKVRKLDDDCVISMKIAFF